MRKTWYSLLFTFFLFLFFSWAAYEAYGFVELAMFFPFYISIAAAFLTLIELIFQLKKIYLLNNHDSKSKNEDRDFRAVGKYIMWVFGYLLLIYLFGFLIATVLFLFTFLFYEAKFGIFKASLSVAVTILLLNLFSNAMTLYWPKGLVSLF